MDDSSLIASFSLKDESLLARKIVEERMRKWHLGKKDNWFQKELTIDIVWILLK